MKSLLLGSAGAELQISIEVLPQVQSLTFICGAPARAFVNGTVGHTSFVAVKDVM
jgi:hypothetical protein